MHEIGTTPQFAAKCIEAMNYNWQTLEEETGFFMHVSRNLTQTANYASKTISISLSSLAIICYCS